MSCRLNSFCNSSIELITYFRGIGRPPFLSSVMSRGQLKSPPIIMFSSVPNSSFLNNFDELR